MNLLSTLLVVGYGLGTVLGISLENVCTVSHAERTLSDVNIVGLTFDNSSITAQAVYNFSTENQVFWPDAQGLNYCNITLAYSHNGIRGDRVLLEFWLPAPGSFKNRWLSTGGGGYSINHHEEHLPGGLIYGAVTGQTDGGFGGFNRTVDEVILLANGTIDHETLYMHGYKAHYEMSTIGKAFTRNFYRMSPRAKLFSYFQGCSEGGREAFSQVQRYPDEWDGAVIGAPAIRLAQQQVNLIFGAAVKRKLGHFPSPCEMNKITDLIIEACDSLDGRLDGVVSRTDLCMINFDFDWTIGKQFECSTDLEKGTPLQSGKVSPETAMVARTIFKGLHSLDGKRAYIWPQLSAGFDSATAQYDAKNQYWKPTINSLGTQWVSKFLELKEDGTSSTADNATYDELIDWMRTGWQRYESVLQTTWPDLTPFESAGGKIIHFHGESDPAIPAGSSVHYHEAVRQVMYPHLSFEDSMEAINDWNRLYLVPGAGHCAPSNTQPNGSFPRTTLKTLIRWVENGIKPENLDAVILQGDNFGEHQQLCPWPSRPMWHNNGTRMECAFDQTSFETWTYNFDAYNLPLY
ncbi:hypothetical protein VI817_008732 [Penicillium citrinum]|nr:hypothetical protein VI817_008732 [Penicillium citrinum]